MYELEDHYPDVADQIDALPRVARNDHKAAIAFILQRPFDADLLNRRTLAGSRHRAFGLSIGLILYTISTNTNRVRLERVVYLGLVGRPFQGASRPLPPPGGRPPTRG